MYLLFIYYRVYSKLGYFKMVKDGKDGAEILTEAKGQFEKLLSKSLKYFSPFYKSNDAVIFNEDCLQILSAIPENSIDMIFADPPYMLSNDGFSCRSGKRVNVNKGKWDKSNGFEIDALFHNEWISACRRVLKPEGTIWISGTYHSIYQCG
jgi:site-specific DNA-methyltransferase (adenine-specific)